MLIMRLMKKKGSQPERKSMCQKQTHTATITCGHERCSQVCVHPVVRPLGYGCMCLEIVAKCHVEFLKDFI